MLYLCILYSKNDRFKPAIFAGGANEIRTRDLLNAIQTRYQLRYNPIPFLCNCLFFSSLALRLDDKRQPECNFGTSPKASGFALAQTRYQLRYNPIPFLCYYLFFSLLALRLDGKHQPECNDYLGLPKKICYAKIFREKERQAFKA